MVGAVRVRLTYGHDPILKREGNLCIAEDRMSLARFSSLIGRDIGLLGTRSMSLLEPAIVTFGPTIRILLKCFRGSELNPDIIDVPPSHFKFRYG